METFMYVIVHIIVLFLSGLSYISMDPKSSFALLHPILIRAKLPKYGL